MAAGASQDNEIQLESDGSGQKIDNAALLRDDGTTINRQRIVIASDENPRQQALVSGEVGDGYLKVKVDGIDDLIIKIDELIEVFKFYLAE